MLPLEADWGVIFFHSAPPLVVQNSLVSVAAQPILGVSSFMSRALLDKESINKKIKDGMVIFLKSLTSESF
jgi:hypothetical protein